MRRLVCVLSILLVLCVRAWAQAPASERRAVAPSQGALVPTPTRQGVRPAATDRPLAVRRVVLYKNGIGFFEHSGRVTGNQDVTVTFTSAQLDDALKSLTALDLGKGQIAGITYNSTAPLAQRLAHVSFRLGEKGDRAEFFRSVRGARLEVRTPRGTVQGRLLSVDQQDPVYGSSPDAQVVLMLASDTGQVTSLRVGPDTGVRLLDRDISSSVAQYLSTVADEYRRDERRVTIATRGTGARDIYVSYVSEVPVWKSTYRLLLPSGARTAPVLQGWAVVDNTVGEDWVDVEMALVAGAPQSFVQRLSQPHYLRRPVVALPTGVQLVPQTHEAGIASRSGAGGLASGVGGDNIVAPPPRPQAMFSLSESVSVTGTSPVIDTSSSTVFRAGIEDEMLAQLPAATGRSVGELFEYKLAERVTVRKNQSALVPIVKAEVEAERISVWNDQVGASRPLRAVWLTNSSGLTLDGGTVSIVDGGAFAGEGTIGSLVPGEKRLVSFARDLSMAVDAKPEPDRRRLVRVRATAGTIVEHRETCGQRVYTIRNDDRAPRTLVVEHPRRNGWTLTAAQSATESTPVAHRFRVTVPAASSSTLVVREVYPSEQRIETTDVTVAQVDLYATYSEVGPSAAAALRRLLELRDAASRLDATRAASERQAASIRVEQGHVRQNMGVLKGSEAERQLLQRYVRQLDEQENRLAALALEIADLTRQAQAARQVFETEAKGLALDMVLPGTQPCQ